jgi:hypothetical protein
MLSTAKTISSEIIQPGIYPGIAMKARMIAKLASIIPPRKIQCPISPAAMTPQDFIVDSASGTPFSHPVRKELFSSLSP